MPKHIYRNPKRVLQDNFKQNNDMEKLDLKKIELPLSKKKFKKLRNGIEKGRIRWRDLSRELTYAYQAFWRAEKHKNYE